MVAATLVAFACGSKVATPAYTEHPTSALTPVPFPPPPARAEIVPQQPNDRAVWIDGEWVWQTRRWAWRKGRWIVPPAGARFAPWTTVRDEAGNLYVANGVWRSSNGEEVTEPPPIGQARPRGTDVVTPEGDVVEVGQPATSASAMRAGHDERREAREMRALDASGPPTLASDAAVSDQLLDASAEERAPRLPPMFRDASASADAAPPEASKP
jgi:hypothetical protein